MGLRLIIEDYDGETTVVPLNGEDGSVTVGRQDSNTIQLTEQNVSRRHAKFNFDGQHWLVEDLSSYNGVRINGRQLVNSAQLDEGDVVQIGDYRLILGSDAKSSDHQISTQRNRAANDDTVIGLSTKTSIQAGEPTRNIALETVPSVVTTELRPVTATVQPRASNTTPAEETPEESAPKKRGLWVILVAIVALVGVAGLALSGNDERDDNQARSSATSRQALPPAEEQTGAGQAATPQPGRPTPAATPALPSTQMPGNEGALLDGAPPLHNPNGHPNPDTSATVGDPAKGQVEPTQPAQPTQLPGGQPAQAGDPLDPPLAQPGTTPTGGAAQKPDALPSSDTSGQSGVDNLAAEPTETPGRPQRNPARAAVELRLAQEASFANDFEKARELARKSYEHNFSADALRILGFSACKLGARKDARWAYDKLRLNFRSDRAEQIRADLQQVCATHGINLGP